MVRNESAPLKQQLELIGNGLGVALAAAILLAVLLLPDPQGYPFSPRAAGLIGGAGCLALCGWPFIRAKNRVVAGVWLAVSITVFICIGNTNFVNDYLTVGLLVASLAGVAFGAQVLWNTRSDPDQSVYLQSEDGKRITQKSTKTWLMFWLSSLSWFSFATWDAAVHARSVMEEIHPLQYRIGALSFSMWVPICAFAACLSISPLNKHWTNLRKMQRFQQHWEREAQVAARTASQAARRAKSQAPVSIPSADDEDSPL